ncbi:hypothetical protein C8F04DRAFT_1348972 [Mycena alexandri]|uniref:Uncharacterized protein n=1 Tax=Mycena alexandri TaxID=1745969 RepID=A0AAD6X4B6_9AGAR|nr:hypothetical protein C8F04DRAFT_1348972 [Mycena alexandri]
MRHTACVYLCRALDAVNHAGCDGDGGVFGVQECFEAVQCTHALVPPTATQYRRTSGDHLPLQHAPHVAPQESAPNNPRFVATALHRTEFKSLCFFNARTLLHAPHVAPQESAPTNPSTPRSQHTPFAPSARRPPAFDIADNEEDVHKMSLTERTMRMHAEEEVQQDARRWERGTGNGQLHGGENATRARSLGCAAHTCGAGAPSGDSDRDIHFTIYAHTARRPGLKPLHSSDPSSFWPSTSVPPAAVYSARIRTIIPSTIKQRTPAHTVDYNSAPSLFGDPFASTSVVTRAYIFLTFPSFSPLAPSCFLPSQEQSAPRMHRTLYMCIYARSIFLNVQMEARGGAGSIYSADVGLDGVYAGGWARCASGSGASAPIQLGFISFRAFSYLFLRAHGAKEAAFTSCVRRGVVVWVDQPSLRARMAVCSVDLPPSEVLHGTLRNQPPVPPSFPSGKSSSRLRHRQWLRAARPRPNEHVCLVRTRKSQTEEGGVRLQALDVVRGEYELPKPGTIQDLPEEVWHRAQQHPVSSSPLCFLPPTANSDDDNDVAECVPGSAGVVKERRGEVIEAVVQGVNPICELGKLRTVEGDATIGGGTTSSAHLEFHGVEAIAEHTVEELDLDSILPGFRHAIFDSRAQSWLAITSSSGSSSLRLLLLARLRSRGAARCRVQLMGQVLHELLEELPSAFSAELKLRHHSRKLPSEFEVFKFYRQHPSHGRDGRVSTGVHGLNPCRDHAAEEVQKCWTVRARHPCHETRGTVATGTGGSPKAQAPRRRSQRWRERTVGGAQKKREEMDDEGQDHEGKCKAGGRAARAGRTVLARMKRQNHQWIRKKLEE